MPDRDLFDDLENTESGAPLVLLVDVETEGLRSALKASGRQYKVKRLDSSPDNWQAINGYFDEFSVTVVVLKLTGRVYKLLVEPEYEAVRGQLFQRLSSVPHAIFVYEDLLDPDADATTPPDPLPEGAVIISEEEWGLFNPFYTPPADVRAAVIRLMSEVGLNVVPYRTNAQLTVLATDLVTDACSGLLFRLYIPTGRLWANEIDKFLQLFRDYLSRIGHPEVRLAQQRTQHGIEYEFFGVSRSPTSSGNKELSDHFRDFTTLLDLSTHDPAAAEAVLRATDVDPRDVTGILTRYAKEAKRLQIDIKHEREQKLLSIRQRLESDLVDVITSADWPLIARLIESTLPAAPSLGPLTLPSLTDVAASPPNAVTVNIGQYINSAVRSVVASEIRGHLSLTQEDQRILNLVRQLAPERESEFDMDIQVLADTSAPKTSRLTAVTRLKSFVFQAAAKVPDVGVGLLVSYLEKRFLG